MLSLWFDLGRPGHQAKDHIEKQKTGSHADFLSALAIEVIQLLIVISNWASFNHIYDTNLDKDDATELEVALVARHKQGDMSNLLLFYGLHMGENLVGILCSCSLNSSSCGKLLVKK
jgi:hypothetical protein